MEAEAGIVIFSSHGDRRTNVAGAKSRRTTAATFVWFLMGQHQAGYFWSIGTAI
jgi:hypothetical protein